MWGHSGTGMSTHPGDENSPKWAEPGIKSSQSRVSPGLGFRPHELDLGQKPPRDVGRGPPESSPAGVSGSLNSAGCMCACLGWGWGGGRGQPEVAAQRWGRGSL